MGEAKRVLAGQLDNLEELARFVAAHVASRVVGEESLLTNRRFVAGIDVASLRFDPEEIRRRWASCREEESEPYPWSFDPTVMGRFREAPAVAETAPSPNLEPVAP